MRNVSARTIGLRYDDRSIIAGSSVSPAAWTPLTLGSASKARWLASGLSSGAVTTWTDSISGIAPTQGTAGLRPVQSATSFNSAYPGVTSDGVDDLLTTTTNISLLPNGTNAGMIIAFAQYLGAAGGAGTGNLLSYGTASAHANRTIQRVASSNPNRLNILDGTTSLTDASVDISGAHIIVAGWSAVTQFLWIDGTAASTPSNSAAFSTGTTRFTLFANISNASPGNWCLTELLITSLLTTDQRQQVEGYGAAAYNLRSLLPVSHPYKSTAP